MKRLLTIAIVMVLFGCTQQGEMGTQKDYFKVDGNPLFNEFNEPIDFKSLEASHINVATDTIITHCDLELKGIYDVEDASRTFDNTMLKLDDIHNDLARITDNIYLIGYTHPDSTIRNTALEAINKLQKYSNELSLKEDLYSSVKAYSKTDEAGSLTGYKKKYTEETVREFERNGFGLDEEGRAKLKSIKDSIGELGNTFNKNIASYQDHLIVSEEEIEGLPEDYKKARRQEDGTYKIDLSYPSFLPFMKYSVSDEARKQLYIKFRSRATDSNLEVLRNLLQKRKDMSDLLGYKSYAEWRLEDRMAKKPETVWDFEYDLEESIKPKADADYQELLKIKTSGEANTDEQKVMPWESSYLQNILLEEKYQLDAEVVKQYFPLDSVLAGLFKITQTIFDVTYEEIENPSVWHEDVRAFQVLGEGKMIGRFYLDLFPRENKYSHAACFGMIEGKMLDWGYQIPNATLVCNFPAPTKDKPSLMPHDQVETFFHEFGHVLHQMLTTANLYEHSGTSVARDFVEAPSQIFENWVWNYESLQLFARHYESGDTLPKELFDKMIAAKNVGSGLHTENQIYYGLIDMTLHDKFDPYGDSTTDDVVEELRKEISHFPYIEETHFQAAFGHLYGYGASYYGYLWSKVYSEDMFSVFKKNGVLDQETGLRYRNIILASGGSEEPMELVKKFLGRESNNKAFMESLGLEADETL